MAKKKKVKKIVAISSAAVVLIGGGLFGYTALAKAKSSDTTTVFRQAQAQTGNVEVTVSGSGTISDSTEYTLTATNAGTVDSLPVKQGDTVKAGQTIAHIGNTNSADTVLQKQNALASAKNALAQSQQNLNSLSIKTPTAGKVKSIIASAGDDLSTIKALGNLAVVSTDRSMTVSVSSAQQSLKVGDSVTVTDTSTNKSYTGTVTSTSGTQSSQSNNQGNGSSQGSGGTSSGSGSSGNLVVTIGTDDPKVGDSVSVTNSNGNVGTGTLALAKYIAISSSGSGTIDSVAVSENQMVNKNDVLFKLNSDSVQNDIQMKQNAVTQAQKDLDDAQAAADKDTVTSPVDGIVAELSVKNGSSVTSSSTIATIFDPNMMQTVVSVDEEDFSKVQVGQKANVTLDAISGTTFTGDVVQVDPIGTSSNGVTNFNVTVDIENPTGIEIGMNANVAIITQSSENVVTLPASAILNKKGSTAYVLSADSLIDSNGKSITLKNTNTSALIQKYGKQISIGLANTDTVEVTSGLSSGDKVAVAITTSKAAIASLSNSTNGATNFSSFGGMMGGNYTNRSRTSTGTGGTAGNSGNSNRSAGSGNTGAAAGNAGAAGGGSGNYGNSGNAAGKSNNGGTGN